jgi:hypothetical protein
MIEAFRLIFSGDSGLLEIVSLSLRVSGIALLFSTLIDTTWRSVDLPFMGGTRCAHVYRHGLSSGGRGPFRLSVTFA